MAELFDMELRAQRRDRAARMGIELFLFDRVFADCVERMELVPRRVARALLLGCPDPGWPSRLGADRVEVRDPGGLFAAAAGGEPIVEDAWLPNRGTYDLVVAVGTLDTVNNLPLALRLLFEAMTDDALFIGAMSGGETLPRLRSAMRAADAVSGVAAAHTHPRIEPSALAPLLSDAGFVMPVVDVDRVSVSYASFAGLLRDLRAMGATNVLRARARAATREAYRSAKMEFEKDAPEGRTAEIFEILHFAAWKNPSRDR